MVYIAFFKFMKCGFKDGSVGTSCSSVARVTVRKQMFSADGGLSSSIHFTLITLTLVLWGSEMTPNI